MHRLFDTLSVVILGAPYAGSAIAVSTHRYNAPHYIWCHRGPCCMPHLLPTERPRSVSSASRGACSHCHQGWVHSVACCSQMLQTAVTHARSGSHGPILATWPHSSQYSSRHRRWSVAHLHATLWWKYKFYITYIHVLALRRFTNYILTLVKSAIFKLLLLLLCR